ncbi:MAG: hypothetical protein V4629_04245 [Pseudomonadota bacterium]
MKIINTLSVISLAAHKLNMSSGFVHLQSVKKLKSISTIYMVGMPMRNSSSWNDLHKVIPEVVENADRKTYWDLCTSENNFHSDETEESSKALPLKKYVKKITKEAIFQVGSHFTEIHVSLAARKKVR